MRTIHTSSHSSTRNPINQSLYLAKQIFYKCSTLGNAQVRQAEDLFDQRQNIYVATNLSGALNFPVPKGV